MFDIKFILVIAYIFRGFYCNSLCNSVLVHFESFFFFCCCLVLTIKLLLLHRCLNVNTYCKDTLNLIFICLLSIEKNDTFSTSFSMLKSVFCVLHIKLFAFSFRYFSLYNWFQVFSNYIYFMHISPLN